MPRCPHAGRRTCLCPVLVTCILRCPVTHPRRMSGGRTRFESGWEGHFDGPRVDCEQVPLLPARAVAWVLDDPRKIPYLFVWKRAEDGSVREAVRVSAYSELAGWADIKRTDGTRNLIRTLLKPLPRNGGKA